MPSGHQAHEGTGRGHAQRVDDELHHAVDLRLELVLGGAIVQGLGLLHTQAIQFDRALLALHGASISGGRAVLGSGGGVVRQCGVIRLSRDHQGCARYRVGFFWGGEDGVRDRPEEEAPRHAGRTG